MLDTYVIEIIKSKNVRPETAHEKKYRTIIKQAGLAITKDTFMGRTREVWRSLYEKNEHLNNVPLREWDIIVCSYWTYQGRRVIRTLCDGVCAYKQLVKDWILE